MARLSHNIDVEMWNYLKKFEALLLASEEKKAVGVFAEFCKEYFKAAVCNIYAENTSSKDIFLLTSSNINVNATASIKPGLSLLTQAWENTQQTLVSSEIDLQSEIDRLIGITELTSLLFQPVRLGDVTIGLIELVNPERTSISKDDFEFAAGVIALGLWHILTKADQDSLANDLLEGLLTIFGGFDSPNLLEVASTIGRSISRAEFCAVYLVDFGEGKLKLEATAGFASELVGIVEYPIGEDILGKVCASGQSINIENLHDQLIKNEIFDRWHLLKWPQVHNPRSLLALPIYFQNHLLGVIEFSNRMPGLAEKVSPFNASDQKRLGVFSRTIGTVLQIAQNSEQSDPSIMLKSDLIKSLRKYQNFSKTNSIVELWRFQLTGEIIGIKTINAGEEYVAVSNSGQVVIFTFNGDVERKLDLSEPFTSFDVYSQRDVTTIVAGSAFGKLICFSVEGNVLWSIDIYEPVNYVHVANFDSVILVGTKSLLISFDYDGNVIRKTEIKDGVSVLDTTSSSLVVGSLDRKVLFWTKNMFEDGAEPKVLLNTHDHEIKSILQRDIDADAKDEIVVGGEDFWVYVISSDHSLQWSKYLLDRLGMC